MRDKLPASEVIYFVSNSQFYTIAKMPKRWVKLGTKVMQTNFESLSRPYKLTYVITKECHSKCINCEIWKVKPKNELTLEEITEFAKNSPFLSWVDFTGGQPTDRPDFVEIVQTFLEHCDDLLLVDMLNQLLIICTCLPLYLEKCSVHFQRIS